jgi:hypothetical protein
MPVPWLKRILPATLLLLALLASAAVSLAALGPESYFEGPWEVEPNNKAQEANGPLRSQRAYYGYPNDLYDVFYFEATRAGRMTAELTGQLTGHGGQGVQLHLCYQTLDNRVDYDPDPPYHVEHNGQAGRYYLYIYTESAHNSNTAYTLRATFPMVHRVYLPMVAKRRPNRPPASPSSPSPANGATGQRVDVQLSWVGGDPDGDAVTYDVYLEAGDSTPDDLVCSNRTTASCAPGTLAYSTRYYWQVVARDSRGVTTTGPVWDFWTEAEPCTDPPTTPHSPSPSSGATDVAVTTSLSWSGGHPCPGESVTYDVYLEAGDSTPDNLICEDVSTPTCDPPGSLSYSTHYYWRVVANGTNGPTTGPVWSFLTEPAPCTDPPTTPYDPSPSHGATDVAVTMSLSWSGGHPCSGEPVTYDVTSCRCTPSTWTPTTSTSTR